MYVEQGAAVASNYDYRPFTYTMVSRDGHHYEVGVRVHPGTLAQVTASGIALAATPSDQHLATIMRRFGAYWTLPRCRVVLTVGPCLTVRYPDTEDSAAVCRRESALQKSAESMVLGLIGAYSALISQ